MGCGAGGCLRALEGEREVGRRLESRGSEGGQLFSRLLFDGLVAVGLLQGAMALVLFVRCAATRRRRRRAERDLAGLEARPAGLTQLSDVRLRALVEGIGELATETHPTLRPPDASASLAQTLCPRVTRLLAELGGSWPSSTRDRRARAGSLVLLGLAPNVASLRPLTTALHGDDPGMVSLASAALGQGASHYPGAAVALASVLRSRPGVGSLTTAWALDRALRVDRSRLPAVAAASSPRARRCAVAVAAAAAASLPPTEAMVPLALVQEATRDRDDHVRTAACRALGKLPAEAGLALLAGGLLDSSAQVTRAAAAALGELGTRAAAAVLAKRLPTADADLVPHLLRALEGVTGALPQETLGWLSGDDDRLTALALRCAVAMRGAEAAWPTVIGLLGHATPGVRTAAARASGAFLRRLPPGPERSGVIQALLSVLQTEQDVPALGAIGDALAVSGDTVAAQSILARMPELGRPGRERLIESVALGELLGPPRRGAR